MELLKQRRIWAGVAALIVLTLPLLGYKEEVSADTLTNSIMNLVEAVAGLAAFILPIWSYFKPKE